MRTISDNEFMQLQDLDVNTKVERLANVFTPVEFDARLTDLRTHGRDRGSFKPFWDQWGDKFLIRPKELTIVFGSRGSYKSTVVNYLIADWLMAGKGRAGLISYEMEPEDLLIMFIEQMANSTDFTDDFAAQAMTFMEDRLLMIDEMVDSPHAAIAKVNAMLVEGCKLVVLDCLQRVNMPSNDIDMERQFVVELTNLVRKHDAHCIVVHHSRKGSHTDGDNPKPVIDDCKGSGGLIDNAHNVMSVWSNKKKKDLMFKVDSGYNPDEDELELLQMPDVLIDVKKQRKHFFEGTIGLWRTKARAFHLKNQRARVL
tara:strand:+ start:5427 stop:6365 length:939 start_codon:yes stop_codon:yes gene_type:complete